MAPSTTLKSTLLLERSKLLELPGVDSGSLMWRVRISRRRRLSSLGCCDRTDVAMACSRVDFEEFPLHPYNTPRNGAI